MSKKVFLIIISVVLFACQRDQATEMHSESASADEVAVVQSPRSLYSDACAEVSQTRMFEGSKRVDILKSVGALSSQKAVKANELMTQTLESTNSLLEGPQRLADAGLGDVRSTLAGQITEACVDELVVLQENVCLLSVLAAIDLVDNPEGSSDAMLELTMRIARLYFKQCDEELESSVLSLE